MAKIINLVENYIVCDGGNIFSNGKLLSWEERCHLAKTTINSELLEILSQDEDYYVRVGVAQNPSTPIEVLEKLSQDVDNWVRHWARNTLKKRP